ncbi:sigma-70 family RNA polymerase sigma factor [Flagellimonas olearia]|uniref:Sigma-70 family RNA polymerase sigma factor n=1 Tax=Flagellimonas olearia TaxID=552546 RepID=A0A6I1E1I0_9FLAO|nr:sigma-70 family RNA polymerase sigma factor [Allomuricauda olearia]KAB7531498.1 sigma-70 family RNA polymerase sigma factor [Allomuricauda olearia]
MKLGIHNLFVEKKDDVILNGKDSNNVEIDEVRLWEEFQSGSEVAYSMIYTQYVGMMYNYGMKLIRDEELVKDCVQDLFVELFNAKHRLGKVRSIKSYLFKSIRRKLIFECKKRRIQRTDFGSKQVYKNQVTPSFERSLIEKQIFDDQRQKVLLAMGKLTDRQREVIHLKFYALLSYSEISEVMSLSIKGTYKLMARSISSLKSYIGKM